VETREPNLSIAMQWINVSYATNFNRKRGRRGHLFQGRFIAILIDADDYLKHLSRYIHLNPVRAKMVPVPAKFPWSSYSAFIGKSETAPFLETDWLLSNFGKSKKEARRNYKDFVEKADIKALENPQKQVSEGFILGDADFVNWVKEAFLSGRTNEKEIPQLRKLKPKVQLETVINAVCKEFDCNKEQIVLKGRKKNKARELSIHLARDLSGMSCKDLGEYFGGVSGALITIMNNRVAREAAENRQLRRRIDRVKKRIFNI
jgi:putative transposase